ncbi:MAG: hypothetical protein H6686_12315 [Fibrobacteria bacterium]|nr:hypothetical protein [Fibrobacteria bacterium]
MVAPLLLSLLTFLHGTELWRPVGPWTLRAGVSAGYSHYDGVDLNRTLVLLENLTREAAGTNPYAVKGFDGHPAAQKRLGVRRGPWNLDLEMEQWIETFHQSEVPFNLEDNDRDNRITCDDLRVQADRLTSLAGCIQASERFLFVPLTAQVSWMPAWTSWMRAGFGYGLGVLAGDASVTLDAQYLGPDAAPDDQITFAITPDPLVTPVHKWFASLEWVPTRFFGLELRGGWRLTHLPSFVLAEKQGSSQVFDAAFDYPETGDYLWIQAPGRNPEVQSIWIGSREEAVGRSSRYSYHAVEGNFDGWFLAGSVVFEWRFP